MDVIIKVKVKPSSKKFEIKEGDPMIVSLRSPAEDNKANLELVKEFTKRYGRCKILKGLKSKMKVVEV